VNVPETITDPALAALPGVRHAFFTARGGVSTGVYESLTVGVGSRDDPAAVVENRRRAAAFFGQPPEQLATCYQTHSADAWIITASVPLGRAEGDALVTDRPGLICGALSADCAPVLLADAEARIVASAHAGWRGALGGVVANTVSSMERLGARRERIVAAVGPCIGPASYEVGPEFRDRFVGADPGHARFFAANDSSEKSGFDLPAFVLQQLARAGVEHASWVGRDTCAEPGVLFSNRRAVLTGAPDYGRLLSAIMLS
jgi:hypothetical protein